MCRVPVQLRELVKQRLAAAAEEIFELLEKTITEYEEHLVSKYEQQRRQGALYSPGPALPELTPETPHLAAAQPQSVKSNDESPERIQILNAQGPVKEEQLLVTIAQTLVKEEPAAAAIDRPSLCDRVNEERPRSKALSLLFIKQEQTEQSIDPPPINGPSVTPPGLNRDFVQEERDTNRNLDQNPNQGLNQGFNPSPDQEERRLGHILDQNPNQNPTQDQDLNEDFEEDNVEWEFEGLTPPRQSPDETENSSEEEGAFHPSKPLRIHDHSFDNSGGGGDSRAIALETDDEKTENSSDVSDNEEPTVVKTQRQFVVNLGNRLSETAAQTKELRIVCSKMVKTSVIAARDEDGTGKSETGTKQKRKRRRRKKEGAAGSSHTCAVCQRTFDSRKKMAAHMKAHAESLPCPVCGKAFKHKGFLAKHMSAHHSEAPSQEAAGKTGKKRKAKVSHKKVLFKKRRREEEERGHTDPDQTEDSSDDH